MKHLKPVLLLVVCSAAIGGAYYGYGRSAPAEPESYLEAPSRPQAGPASIASQDSSPTANDQQNDLVKQLAILFLERYGESIEHPATQAKLYEEWQTLLSTYPEHGQWLFEAALELAFPELKDRILSLLQRLALYHQWLDNNYLTLQRMPILERQAAIWEKRAELFGADAERIWEEEQIAMNQKQLAVQETLQRLDQAHDLSPSDAAYQLQAAVDEVYGEGFGRQLITPDVMASALFSLESVQAQLQALPEEERQAHLNALRRQLGYPEDVIVRLEEQDKKRDERWKQGYQYMAERDQLSRQYSGDRLTQELDALRQKHFGRAAHTIAREEEEGFYRFNRPRRLGLN